MNLDSVIDALRDVGRDVKGVLGRGAGYGMQNIQNALPEALRNYAKTSEWLEKKQAQDLYGGDFEAQERADKMMGFGTDAGGLVGAIKASHGSPHLFDKFDFSKIGTGEGAQAYGHGGYFAQGFDSPVAQQYREALSGGAKKAVNASFSDDPELWVAGQLHSGIKPSEITEGLGILGYKGNPSDLIKSAESRLKDELSAGHLYNVELKWPDAAREAADPLGEQHLLDWDAPMMRQSPSVKKAWLETQKDLPENAIEDLGGDLSLLYGREVTPEDFLGTMSSLGGNPGFGEQLLRKQGIPGIRYLDQGSRGAGTGSRNYVMFDDQFPEIITRNGQAIAKALREK